MESLRPAVDMPLLFDRIQQLENMKFDLRIKKFLRSDQDILFTRDDIVEISSGYYELLT